MNITLNKFIKYLNDNYTRIISEKIDDRYINFIDSIYNFIENYNSENKFIFAEFDMLSDLLINGDFKIKEQYEIVYNILSMDLRLSLNGPVTFDPYKILNMYSNDEYEYLNKVGETIDLNKIISNPEMCDDKGLVELLQSYSLLRKNYVNGIELLRKSNFFTCNYSTNDIDQIVLALKTLGFNEELTNNIKSLLLNKLDKTKNKKDIIINFTKINDKKEKLLTDKEYKTLKSKIKKIYDLYNGVILNDLTYNEAIEIGNILYTLGYDDFEIQRFFMNFNKYKKDINILEVYLNNYDKLKFYEEKIGYNLSMLDEYYNEFLNTSGSDKIFWKNEFEILLSNILHKIENHYEYEIQESKKLSLKNV